MYFSFFGDGYSIFLSKFESLEIKLVKSFFSIFNKISFKSFKVFSFLIFLTYHFSLYSILGKVNFTAAFKIIESIFVLILLFQDIRIY